MIDNRILLGYRDILYFAVEKKYQFYSVFNIYKKYYYYIVLFANNYFYL